MEDAKADDIVSIDLAGKTSIGDTMVVASGRSQRHVGAIADRLLDKLKESGVRGARVEGMPLCDWVLIDAGDVIVHVFRPEARAFYNIEKMWTSDKPKPGAAE
jgi:ribosome-associated protein